MCMGVECVGSATDISGETCSVTSGLDSTHGEDGTAGSV